jgi:DNA polymerase-3 subunit gamma/tau
MTTSRTSGSTASAPRMMRAPEPQAASSPQPAAQTLALARFEDVIALAAARRDLVMKAALEQHVHLVRFEDGKLEIALEAAAPKTLVNELTRKLADWTGRRWLVIVSAETGAPTVRAQSEARQSEIMRGVRTDPLVQAVLARFPGAEIVGVRRRDDAQEPAADGDELPPPDDDVSDDD